MNVTDKKNFLRKKLLQKRKKIPASKRRRKSQRIFEKLFKAPRYRKAKKIALYVHLVSEVETKPFLKRILKAKEVFLPRTVAKNNLVLHRVRALAKDLHKGVYSILEPRPRCPQKSVAAMDLVVVPGVGFDRKGNRLGRGAGYYDRLLKKAGGVRKIGICFREQLVQKIPMTKRDRRVDQVITD